MRKARRLVMERLETRHTLSGDVVVSVVAGDLVIQGDVEDNFLFLWQDNGTGDWVVVGGRRPVIPGQPTETLVNGQPGPQTFSGVTGGLQTDMGYGFNVVVLTNAEVLGVADLTLGPSIEQIFLETSPMALSEAACEPNQGTTVPWGPLVFHDDLTIDAGGEWDQIVLNGNIELHGDLTIDAGAGTDWLRMHSLTPLHVPGNMTIDLGEGNDRYDLIFLEVDGDLTITDPSSGIGENPTDQTEIQVHNTTVGGRIEVTAGIGVTQLEFEHVVADDIYASLGNGNDKFQAINVQANHFSLDTGGGNDAGDYWYFEQQRFERSIFLQNVQVANVLNVRTSSGDDSVYMTDINAHYVVIDTDIGSDGVLAFGVTADEARFYTGDNADIIGLYQIEVVELGLFTGAGNEGGGYFGAVIGDSSIYGTLTIDTGDGLDNLLLGSLNAANVNIATGLGSDGVIMQYCNMIDTTVNTGDSLDVVGIYDSNFQDLIVLLGTGVDQLSLGRINVYRLTSLRGEAGSGTLRRIGSNLLTGLTVSNLKTIS
jgi:hypothetical protein